MAYCGFMLMRQGRKFKEFNMFQDDIFLIVTQIEAEKVLYHSFK